MGVDLYFPSFDCRVLPVGGVLHSIVQPVIANESVRKSLARHNPSDTRLAGGQKVPLADCPDTMSLAGLIPTVSKSLPTRFQARVAILPGGWVRALQLVPTESRTILQLI